MKLTLQTKQSPTQYRESHANLNNYGKGVALSRALRGCNCIIGRRLVHDID